MKKFAAVWVLALVSAFGAASALASEATRLTNPNALSVEALGRGLTGSVSYDRVVNDDAVAGIGFGRAALNNPDGSDSGQSANIVPIYINYYFSRDRGSVFLTGGADIVFNATALQGLKAQLSGIQLSSSGLLPNLGLGYETRGDSGFLFRVAGYVIFAPSSGANVKPWGGLTLGYAF
jgi:hypothetical protein